MLNAVLFDLDNTLVDRDRAFHDCIQTRFTSPEVMAELLRLDQRGRGDRKTLFQFWEQQTGAAMNQAAFGCLLAGHIQPDRCLISTLHKLSTTVKIGIITNGSSDTQRQKFCAAGLAEVFPPNHLWISAEVGKAKPDTAIFLHASRTLAQAPENCLHIGDNEVDDLLGARAAGMRARLVDAPLNANRLDEIIRQERLR